MKRSTKRSLAALLVFPLLCGPAAAQLALYCSNLEAQCRAIANGFERKTGVPVAMIRKSTGEFLAQIRAEGGRPRGDVWWGGPAESHAEAAAEKLLQPYRPRTLGLLHPYFQKAAELTGYVTAGVYVGAVGIGFNLEQLRRRNLPRPACWADLLDPRYRGEIQAPDPRSSGTAFLFLSSTLARLGEEKGWEFIRRLNANINQYAKSGDAPAKALALGETSLAIAFLHGMTPKALENAPVETVLPCEGSGYEVIGVSIIAGAPNIEAARAFVDYALTAEAQGINAALGLSAAPTNPAAAVAPGAPALDRIGLRDPPVPARLTAEDRRRILTRFEAETR